MIIEIEIPEPIDLRRVQKELELRLINWALGESQFSRQGAADLLGIKRTTLIEKMRAQGMVLKDPPMHKPKREPLKGFSYGRKQ